MGHWGQGWPAHIVWAERIWMQNFGGETYWIDANLEDREINGKVILRCNLSCEATATATATARKCDFWINIILLYICHCPFVGVSVSSISISAIPGPSEWHKCKRVSGWSDQHPVQAEAAAGRCSGWGKDICMAVSGLAWNRL